MQTLADHLLKLGNLCSLLATQFQSLGSHSELVVGVLQLLMQNPPLVVMLAPRLLHLNLCPRASVFLKCLRNTIQSAMLPPPFLQSHLNEGPQAVEKGS